MAKQGVRRSDRVEAKFRLRLSGEDASSFAFFEDARTAVVARYGAKILFSRRLVADQEIVIRCEETGRESVARVIGEISKGAEGYAYGIELKNPEGDLWGIAFPPASMGEDAVGRVVLECLHCHAREVVYLNEFELEVLEANQRLTRPYKRCDDSTLWGKSARSVEEAPASEAPPPPSPADKRREFRRELKVVACVRSREFGEELVTTRNVSRSGLCFESNRKYPQGAEIEVAVPYSQGGGNIFLRGKIAHVEESPSAGVTLHGVQYQQFPARPSKP